jgi:cytochrome c peroxidase
MRPFLTILILFSLAISTTWLISACRKTHYRAPVTATSIPIPAGFPAPVQDFSDNPLTVEGIELGRKLFYDPRLSIDNQHSCASCHNQIGAFGTFEHDRSHGVYNSHTLRNAPPLVNLAWSPFFHWDGEFTTLEDEAVHPIHGLTEMGETFSGIKRKIEDDVEYRRAFDRVFGYPYIRNEFILKALAQFTSSIVSADSKYDRVMRGTASFFPPEQAGYLVYQANCASCHPEPLFTDYSFRNIGLPVDNFLDDYGLMRITKKSSDSLKFKVPSLRNVRLTSNYMHDGRFATLMQCINHYRFNVQGGPTVDPLVAGGIGLTDMEANNLVAFLVTLSDSNVLNADKWASPY